MKNIMNKFNEFKKARELNEDGFSLIELVVAVGILAILSVVGVIAYSGITDNARQTAVDAAASDVFTAAIAYDSDADFETTPETAAKSYNDSSEKINVVATKDSSDGTITVTATEVGRDEGDTKSASRDNATA